MGDKRMTQKSIRTCTHSKEGLLEGKCIECDTWETIREDFGEGNYFTYPDGSKSKNKVLTISSTTFDYYKKKLLEWKKLEGKKHDN